MPEFGNTLELRVNTFANKEENVNSGASSKIKWSAEDREVVLPMGKNVQPVDLDGMDKTPVGENVRSVGMDGMNKSPSGGGLGNCSNRGNAHTDCENYSGRSKYDPDLISA